MQSCLNWPQASFIDLSGLIQLSSIRIVNHQTGQMHLWSKYQARYRNLFFIEFGNFRERIIQIQVVNLGWGAKQLSTNLAYINLKIYIFIVQVLKNLIIYWHPYFFSHVLPIKKKKKRSQLLFSWWIMAWCHQLSTQLYICIHIHIHTHPPTQQSANGRRHHETISNQSDSCMKKWVWLLEEKEN